MNWGQVLGGTVMGLGAGMAKQGEMDILEKRQAVRQALAERMQTQRLEYQEGRQDARIQAQIDAQDRRSEDASKLQTQRDDAAMAREKARGEATVEAAKIRKSGAGGERKGKQFQDESGMLWFQPDDGSAARPVKDEGGKQLKGKPDRQSTTAASREERDAKLAVDSAISLATTDSGYEKTVDWGAVADTLDAKGFKTEAAAARRRSEASKPAAPEPAKPGLLDNLKAQAIEAGEAAQPATPPFGSPVATAQQAAAGAAMPKGADGRIARDQLKVGQAYTLPDGRVVQWDGQGFVVIK